MSTLEPVYGCMAIRNDSRGQYTLLFAIGCALKPPFGSDTGNNSASSGRHRSKRHHATTNMPPPHHWHARQLSKNQSETTARIDQWTNIWNDEIDEWRVLRVNADRPHFTIDDYIDYAMQLSTDIICQISIDTHHISTIQPKRFARGSHASNDTHPGPNASRHRGTTQQLGPSVSELVHPKL